MRVLTVALLVATFTLPSTAYGAKSESQRLSEQLEGIRSDLRKAGENYDRAHWQLDETDVRIADIGSSIERTEVELADARVLLGSRIGRMYRTDAVDYLTVLLGANSFDEMVVRLDFVQRITTADADAIQGVEDAQARLVAERAALESEREERERALSDLKKRRDALQDRFASKQAEYEKLKARLDAERRKEQAAAGARPIQAVSSAPAGPNGMVFPVQGVNYYSDTWGASRSGGRRRHQGTDIMAARGTPCVATLSGTVTAKTSSLGGKTIWLRADNGWSFYYAHLDGWAVTSGRVSAGQLIGYVGSTGNASASAPHLHFEIHPGGGAAVNPYPYLRRM
jgi:murein DD-endopeptidase MepM/ murein hydrolase activator NlpD